MYKLHTASRVGSTMVVAYPLRESRGEAVVHEVSHDCRLKKEVAQETVKERLSFSTKERLHDVSEDTDDRNCDTTVSFIWHLQSLLRISIPSHAAPRLL